MLHMALVLNGRASGFLARVALANIIPGAFFLPQIISYTLSAGHVVPILFLEVIFSYDFSFASIIILNLINPYFKAVFLSFFCFLYRFMSSSFFIIMIFFLVCSLSVSFFQIERKNGEMYYQNILLCLEMCAK